MKIIPLHSTLTLIFAALILIILNSCQSGGSMKSLNKEIMGKEKPAIDTSMVLETPELYRAKRYESIQDANNSDVKGVHKLVLHGKQLGKLSPDVGKLTYLSSLDVAHNNLSELPEEISLLHYLQGFYANGNKLVDFPVQILLLPLLARVDLSENLIRAIPGEIMKMDQLTRLSLDNNQITSIPVQLYELPYLHILELANNGLSELPEGIANLSNLKKLNLANNRLTSIPREITTLSEKLEELNIQGNQVPQAEIDWLVNAMPNTQIRF